MALDEPDLPVKLGACSNGEVAPVAPGPVVREAVRRARATALATADRLGMDRRRFLRSSMAAAVTLLAVDGCSREAQEATEPGTRPGGTFDVSTTATTEPEAAVEELGVSDFVLDVQQHFLEYDLDDPEAGSFFGAGFPQARCDAPDARSCFSIDRWRDLVFERSDTTAAVLSAVPILADPDPLSVELMARARDEASAVCDSPRVLIQGHATPNIGDLQAQIAAMAVTAGDFDLAAWKVYTHAGPGFRLDDADPDGLPIGAAFLDAVERIGPPVVAVHKGFSGGSRWADPADVGPAATAHPGLSILVYHSGYESRVREGPFDEQGGGVDRLIRSLRDAGVGHGGNVYAELGSTWRSVMGDPDQAAHVVGKLLVAVGEDRVLWGTDSIWYGSPQDQIQAFRAFAITEEYQERFGYPALTPEVKAKILGINAARLHDLDVEALRCQAPDPAATEEARQAAPLADRLLGPRTASSARRVFAADHPWFVA